MSESIKKQRKITGKKPGFHERFPVNFSDTTSDNTTHLPSAA